MNIRVSAICDKGLARSINEDAILINKDILRDTQSDYDIDINDTKAPFMIAVADGLGGHEAGEVASSFVVSSLSDKVSHLSQGLSVNDLKKTLNILIKEIHEEILAKGRSIPELNGMGSTMNGILFYSNKIFSINVGDSRLYRFRAGVLACLTKDHTLREISGNENSPSNIILNSFGGGKTIFFDFEELSARILTDDVLLICSDGLTLELSDDEIETLIEKGLSVNDLVNAAKSKGGKDNISVILIKIVNKEN